MVVLSSGKYRLVALTWPRMGIKVHEMGDKEKSLTERGTAVNGRKKRKKSCGKARSSPQNNLNLAQPTLHFGF